MSPLLTSNLPPSRIDSFLQNGTLDLFPSLPLLHLLVQTSEVECTFLPPTNSHGAKTTCQAWKGEKGEEGEERQGREGVRQ